MNAKDRAKAWGPILCLAACLVTISGPTIGIAAAVSALVAATILCPQYRLTLIALTATLPYALGAYWGATQDIRFFPRPGLDGYWQASREQATGLLLAAGIAIITGTAGALQNAYKRTLALTRDTAAPAAAFTFVRLAALAVAANDGAVVAANLGSLTSSGRHLYTDQFVAGFGPWGIVVTMTISAALAVDALIVKHAPKASTLAFGAMWAPSVLAGDRAYFSIGALCWIVLYFSTEPSKIRRRVAGAALTVAVAGLTILPTIWSTNERVWMNEWILPNSIFLPMALGVFTRDGLGVAPLTEQWQFLLPGPLRSGQFTTISDIFADLSVTGVSVGGNPWADLFVPADPWVRVLTFAAGTCAVLLIGALLSRVSTLAPLLTFALMVFWGRSLFWGVIVLLVWSSAIAWVAFRPRSPKVRPERSRTEHVEELRRQRARVTQGR